MMYEWQQAAVLFSCVTKVVFVKGILLYNCLYMLQDSHIAAAIIFSRNRTGKSNNFYNCTVFSEQEVVPIKKGLLLQQPLHLKPMKIDPDLIRCFQLHSPVFSTPCSSCIISNGYTLAITCTC